MLEKWKAAHGYATDISKKEYNSYTKEELEALVKAGDILAADRLNYIYDSENTPEKAIAINKLAAAYGSTAALNFLSTWATINWQSKPAPEDIDMATKKRNILDAMAYLKVSSMRGDNSVYFAAILVPTITNPKGIPLTDEDYAKVQGNSPTNL